MNFPTSVYAAKELLRVKTSGSEFVALVHEATNEDPWGPTGQQMDEITRAYQRGGRQIMEELQLRLRHRDKSFRPAYKSLLVLDHLARNVYESALPHLCALIPLLRQIQNSFYYTHKNIDHGLAVRERAKKVADLLSDAVLLREEREKAARTRAKIDGSAVTGSSGGDYGGHVGGSGSGGRVGSSFSAGTTRYAGFGNQSVSGGTYDPYVASQRQAVAPPTKMTREEQERIDMEMAMRLQLDEERRAGVSLRSVVSQLEQTHQRYPNIHESEERELALRLEQEEKERMERAAGLHAPSQAPNTVAPPAVPSKSFDALSQVVSQPPVQAETQVSSQPQPNVLDDLFAPAPVAPPQSFAPAPSAMSVSNQPQSQSPSADPFDAFLNSRLSSSSANPPSAGMTSAPMPYQQTPNSGMPPSHQMHQMPMHQSGAPQVAMGYSAVGQSVSHAAYNMPPTMAPYDAQSGFFASHPVSQPSVTGAYVTPQTKQYQDPMGYNMSGSSAATPAMGTGSAGPATMDCLFQSAPAPLPSLASGQMGAGRPTESKPSGDAVFEQQMNLFAGTHQTPATTQNMSLNALMNQQWH